MSVVLEMAIVFSSIVLVIKIITDAMTRHKLINKGLVDEKVKFLFSRDSKTLHLSNIKWGMVLVGIGLALFIKQFMPFYSKDESVFGLMLIFAGVAFLVYYFLARKQLNKDNNNNISG